MATFLGQHCRPICRLVAYRFEAFYATEIALVTRHMQPNWNWEFVKKSPEFSYTLCSALWQICAPDESSVCASVHGALRTPSAKSNVSLFFSCMAQQPLVGQGLLIIEDSRSHSDTPHSLGLLWTSDQLDAETSTWQQTTLTTDMNGPGRDSNPQPQQPQTRDWDCAATGIGKLRFRVEDNMSIILLIILEPIIAVHVIPCRSAAACITDSVLLLWSCLSVVLRT